jgi:hypothetical protein
MMNMKETNYELPTLGYHTFEMSVNPYLKVEKEFDLIVGKLVCGVNVEFVEVLHSVDLENAINSRNNVWEDGKVLEERLNDYAMQGKIDFTDITDMIKQGVVLYIQELMESDHAKHLLFTAAVYETINNRLKAGRFTLNVAYKTMEEIVSNVMVNNRGIDPSAKAVKEVADIIEFAVS